MAGQYFTLARPHCACESGDGKDARKTGDMNVLSPLE